MPYYHTMILSCRTIKWNTLLANDPAHAIRKAIETWQYYGGRKIDRSAVYEYKIADFNYCYQYAPENVFEDRPNLLETMA